MKARRCLQVCLVLLIASGCARSDWIEGTLVTVDVSGRWTGTWTGSGTAGDFEMTLRQTGPKASGNINLPGAHVNEFSGPILGAISGDVLSFSRPDGRLRGEVRVAVDEMSGTVTLTPMSQSGCCPGGPMAGTKTVKLQRQP
jgi:hypothetical protein